jgi:hypothetical protein
MEATSSTTVKESASLWQRPKQLLKNSSLSGKHAAKAMSTCVGLRYQGLLEQVGIGCYWIATSLQGCWLDGQTHC